MRLSLGHSRMASKSRPPAKVGWGGQSSAGAAEPRLAPLALTVLGVFLLQRGPQGANAPADAGHRGRILKADPLHLRLLASAGQDGHFLHGYKGQFQHRGTGGHWGGRRHLTSVGGQLGVENLATKRSRSMVRTDQLPWGTSGEEAGSDLQA